MKRVNVKREKDKPFVDEVNVEGEELSKKTKKRIYNPWTKSYYSISQRSSVKGKKGTIKGKWTPPAKKKRS